MKKVIYLSIMFVSLILMSFGGCEKDENTTPDPVDNSMITLAELDGDWNIVSYKLSETDLNIFTTCADIESNPATHYENYRLLLLNFKFDSYNMGCKVLDKCFAEQFNNLGMFEFENDIIAISEIKSLVFRVKSYDKTNKMLTLELIEENMVGVAPIGGIYKIQKQ